jgi:hypothetical protein
MGFAILRTARATLASMVGPSNLVSILEGGLIRAHADETHRREYHSEHKNEKHRYDV